MALRSILFSLFFFFPLTLLFSQNDQNKLFFVITKDGTQNIGNVLNETDSQITLRVNNQDILMIPKADIKLYELVTEDNFFRGKYIPPNRFANRYLLGSSATGPGKNKLLLNSVYGLAETLDYGITDQYSVGLSTSIVGAPLLLNAQANYKIGNGLYLGATATGGWLSWAADSIFWGYGGIRLTKGTRSNNYTIGGGYFSINTNIRAPRRTLRNVPFGDFGYFNVSVTGRYTRRISGLGEVWVLKNISLGRSIIYMANLGIRYFRRERSAWTFYASTIATTNLRRGTIHVNVIPCISWSRRLGGEAKK